MKNVSAITDRPDYTKLLLTLPNVKDSDLLKAKVTTGAKIKIGYPF